MTTGTNRFCNKWRINTVERRSTTAFQIVLWQDVNNGPDKLIKSSQYWNPQTTKSGSFCASVPNTRDVFYFRYLKTIDTGLLTGSVTVSDS